MLATKKKVSHGKNHGRPIKIRENGLMVSIEIPKTKKNSRLKVHDLCSLAIQHAASNSISVVLDGSIRSKRIDGAIHFCFSGLVL